MRPFSARESTYISGSEEALFRKNSLGLSEFGLLMHNTEHYKLGVRGLTHAVCLNSEHVFSRKITAVVEHIRRLKHPYVHICSSLVM